MGNPLVKRVTHLLFSLQVSCIHYMGSGVSVFLSRYPNLGSVLIIVENRSPLVLGLRTKRFSSISEGEGQYLLRIKFHLIKN